MLVSSIRIPMFVFVLSAVAGGYPALAQGTSEEPSTTPSESADEATEPAESDASDASTSAPDGESSSESTAFYAKFEDWKKLLKEMRDIRAKYLIAEEEELDALQTRWQELGNSGDAMVAELDSLGRAAYSSAPNADREIVRFLISILTEQVEADDYIPASELAQLLVDGDSKEKELMDLAGRAAFGTNDFENAKQRLKLAVETGTISDRGSNFLRDIDVALETWETEVKLRETEADSDDLPRVKLQLDVGDIVVELFENEAPETVGNFVSLVEKGFYDGLIFHRVLPGFMAQGGCPDGNGSGGPGYQIYCECTAENHRNHFAGSLSMAKTSERNSGGSQFFLNFVATPNLNGEHTVFGRVVEGWDVLPKIARIDPQENKGVQPSKIVKAEVVRKRDHEYRPNKVR